MKSLSDTCRDKAPTVSSSPFFYTSFIAAYNITELLPALNISRTRRLPSPAASALHFSPAAHGRGWTKTALSETI